MNNLFERLGDEAIGSEYLASLFLKTSLQYGGALFKYGSSLPALTNTEYADILRFADILSCSPAPECRNKAFQIISLLYEERKTDDVYQMVAKAVLSKLGNFPSIFYLQNRRNEQTNLPFARSLEHSLKEITQAVPNQENSVFTDSQYSLFQLLKKSKTFSFSGPTSMGKSFIIKVFVQIALAKSPPENLVIMVPTRALINQFSLDLRRDLARYLQEYNFKVITNSNVTQLAKSRQFNYVFVLTPERILSYLSETENPPIGFLFIDEAHKIASQGDARSVTAYDAIEKVLKKYPNINLYFSSPNVANPQVFLELFGRDKGENHFRTSESPVAQNLFFVDLLKKAVLQYIDQKPNKLSDHSLDGIQDFNSLLVNLGSESNNIIYCNARSKTVERAKSFYDYLTAGKGVAVEIHAEVKKAIRQIKSYVHKEYYLARFLEAGIAYHYGNLPQIVRSLVEDLYKRGHIRNVFCTTTLLEGVNLPAKNIFILSSKKNTSEFDPIDFWNLAGRAGRLGKELSGNIFCVRDEEECWLKPELIQNHEQIQLKATVSERIDNNLRRIESLLNGKEISGSEREHKILEYIANIICTDTMEVDPLYKSPLVLQLIHNKKQEILNLAKSKMERLIVPLRVLTANQTIDLFIQDKVFKVLKWASETLPVKLPSRIDYKNCLTLLTALYDLYEWESTQPDLAKSKESLKYIATLINQWTNGISLSQMIDGSIDYQATNTRDFYINHQPVGRFDRNNKEHINQLINDLIENIEKKLRFNLEKYFNHYYLICVEIFGENNAGANWAQFLEYGTQNSIIIALQHLGLSRHTASYVYSAHKNCLIIEDGKLKEILTGQLMRQADKESIEYEEIKTLIY